MTEKKYKLFVKVLLGFILLQPVLDILSRMAILDYIPNISTYLKPLFVFGFTGYLLLLYSPNRKRWLAYVILYFILIIGHMYLLYNLLVDKAILLHEFRFLINIAYMLSLYISFDTIVYYASDYQILYKQIKDTIFYTFIIYFGLYFVSIISGTSGMTYEYADSSKLGFKGWYDSGQILGHAFSVMFPLIMYNMLSPKKSWYVRIGVTSLFILSVSLIGTKVPYYITFIVLILYLFITIFMKVFNKEHKRNYFNIVLIMVMIIVMIFTYKYTPVKHNTDINTMVARTDVSTYDFKKESGYSDIPDDDTLREMYPNEDISKMIEYNNWSRSASLYLTSLFESGELHPSNMRFKQIKYANKKFHLVSLPYKIFGLGYLNQNSALSPESDTLMAFYSFGVLGLVLFLIIPIKEFIVSTLYIIKNIKIIDLETYMLYMGLGIFFSISIYAGYTYIYTNFSIFLMLLILMLKLRRTILKKEIIKNNKITFLLLHLGYGGIETSTINTANSLCSMYDINLVSFYNLDKNQENRVDKQIKIRHLYNGSPNRDEFKNALRNHNLFLIIKEGIKAISILIKKRLYIINEIRNNDSLYLISTRYDFSTLLSKYGYSSNIRIAQEHHYHNDNKKYINILKHKYDNIDDLMALTDKLYNDYKKFLVHNYHTKVVLMPNMLYELPKEISKLDRKNIITMSRFDYGKRNDDIIRAFSMVKDKDTHLYILGDGNEFDNLSKLVKELKIEDRVTMPGYVRKEDMPNYLIQSSIFLMASITEGLPMVLLEAMSYGIPCVAYETASGVNDIIKNECNGYVIKNRNQEEFVKCIDKLIDDDNLRNNMGKEALKTAKMFYKDEVIKKWLVFLRSVNSNENEKEEKKI